MLSRDWDRDRMLVERSLTATSARGAFGVG